MYGYEKEFLILVLLFEIVLTIYLILIIKF